MTTAIKQRRENLIKVKQYITDANGHKVAAVIEIEELIRLKAIVDIIPASEIWLYKNKEVLESVRRGLKDAAKGRISKLNIDELYENPHCLISISLMKPSSSIGLYPSSQKSSRCSNRSSHWPKQWAIKAFASQPYFFS